MKKIVTPLLTLALLNACAAPVADESDGTATPQNSGDFTTEQNEQLAALFGEYGSLDAETGRWTLSAPAEIQDELLVEALEIVDIDPAALAEGPSSESSAEGVKSKEQATSAFTISLTVSPCSGSAFKGWGQIKAHKVDVKKSAPLEYRYTLKRDGKTVYQTTEYCDGGSCSSAPLMLNKPGRYVAHQKTYKSIFGFWVKVENGEFTSNELDVGVPNCSEGEYDSRNCFHGTAPSGTQPFIYEGSLYYTPTPTCPLGTYDTSNCFIAKPPTKPFMWSGHLYYGDIGGSCPVAGSWFDGANCFMAPSWHEPFIYNGMMYVKPDRNGCPLDGSSFDSRNCFVTTPQNGAHAFTMGQNLYTTPEWTCQ